MAVDTQLPPGYVLNNQQQYSGGLPPGYVVNPADQLKQTAQSQLQGAKDVLNLANTPARKLITGQSFEDVNRQNDLNDAGNTNFKGMNPYEVQNKLSDIQDNTFKNAVIGQAADLATNPLVLAGAGIKTAQQIGGGIEAAAQKAAPQSIINLFNKAVSPSSMGKASASQIEAYNNKATSAISTIVENKNNLQFPDAQGNLIGRTPQNINELSQAIDSTKKDLFKQYNDLQQKTGDAQATVDTSGIVKNLDSVINNKVIKIKDPSVINYATNLKQRLIGGGELTPQETQDLIASFNADLKAFYQNPSSQDVGISAVKDGVVKSLRNSLDDVISNTTGQDYQALKTKYGQLSAIEKDVANRVQAQARKNIKGLPDYSDIFSAGDIVKGVLTGNPGAILKGGAQIGMKNYIKYITNPDTSIKKMFNIAEKYPVKTN